MKQRKTDRRTLYTQTVIKDALLELLTVQGFEKITVASLCRQAEITRATFYLHYSDLTAVVDELVDEALEISEQASETGIDNFIENTRFLANTSDPEVLRKHNGLFPTCQRVADDEKYLPLFQDEALSSYVIKHIYMAEKDHMVPLYMNYCHLSQREATLMFMHDIYGAFYMNRAMGWKKDVQWYRMHSILSRYILGAMDALREQERN